MRPLAASLAATALVAVLGTSVSAQSAPPVPAATTVPWQPRPVIIIDPRRYLPSPTPRPRPRNHPTPNPRVRRPLHRAAPHSQPTPDVFERHDTAPPPTTPPRAP
jgi:hypothetical protein